MALSKKGQLMNSLTFRRVLSTVNTNTSNNRGAAHEGTHRPVWSNQARVN